MSDPKVELAEIGREVTELGMTIMGRGATLSAFAQLGKDPARAIESLEYYANVLRGLAKTAEKLVGKGADRG